MFKKGLATLVILLFLGLAVSPSIYADNGKVSLEPIPDLDIDLNRLELRQLGLKLILNNLRLIFLLIFTPSELSDSYLNTVYNLGLDAFKSLDASERDLLLDTLDIENIEFKDEIFSLIEGDGDCGCDVNSLDLEWGFPVICTVLFIPFLFGYFIYISSSPFPASIIGVIGYFICSIVFFYSPNNCYWIGEFSPW